MTGQKALILTLILSWSGFSADDFENLPYNTATNEAIFVPNGRLEEVVHGVSTSLSPRLSFDGAQKAITSLLETWRAFRPVHEKSGRMVNGCYEVERYFNGHTAELVRRDETDTLADLSSRSEVVLAGKIVDERSGLLYNRFGTLLTIETSRILRGTIEQSRVVVSTADWYDVSIDGERICKRIMSLEAPRQGDSVLVLASTVKNTRPPVLAPHIIIKTSGGRILSDSVSFLSHQPPTTIEDLGAQLESLEKHALGVGTLELIRGGFIELSPATRNRDPLLVEPELQESKLSPSLRINIYEKRARLCDRISYLFTGLRSLAEQQNILLQPWSA